MSQGVEGGWRQGVQTGHCLLFPPTTTITITTTITTTTTTTTTIRSLHLSCLHPSFHLHIWFPLLP